MAETQTESSVAGDSSRDRGRGVRTAPLPPVLAKSVPIAQRKRQRLDRVLDKIASQVAVFSGHGKPFESATDVFQLATQASHHRRKKLPLSITADGALPALVRFQAVLPTLDPRILDSPAESMEESTLTVTASLATTGGSGGPGGVIMSTSANNNNTVAEAMSDSRDRFITPRAQSKVFRFDSIDQERYFYGAISEEEENAAGDDLSEEDVFSPHSISSERSPLSPSGTADSPCISFSPLRLKDSAEDEDTLRTDTSTPRGQSTVCLTPGSNNSAPGYHCKKCFPTTFQDHMESSDCHRHMHTSSPGLPPSPLSPATPNTPLLASQGFPTGMTFPAASPLHSLEFLLQARYMEDLSRRRAHSDSDLQSWYDSTLLSQHQQHHTATRGRLATPIVKTKPAPLLACNKGGSLESDPSSPGTQDSPLDLSLRRSTSSTSSESPGLSILGPYSWLSPTTINSFLPSPSASTPSRSPVLRVPPSPGVSSLSSAGTPKSSISTREDADSPPASSRLPAIVAAGAETEGAMTPPSGVTPTGPLVGMEVACVCPVCGQMFALHDRLAKHMASRHKSKSRSSLEAAVTRAYLCDICHRPFARSDMLTRHMRLHTGLKPYTCRVCGQVFSRSDHLSTHQRTHTGEKPYRCPQCPYAACRRDMITRHLRTHTRGEAGSGGGSTPSVNFQNTDTGPLEDLSSTTVQLALPPTGRSRGRRTRNRASEMLARSLSAEDVPFQDHSDISFQTPSPR